MLIQTFHPSSLKKIWLKGLRSAFPCQQILIPYKGQCERNAVTTGRRFCFLLPETILSTYSLTPKIDPWSSRMFHYRGAPVRHIAIMQDELQGVSAALDRGPKMRKGQLWTNPLPPPVRAFTAKKKIFLKFKYDSFCESDSGKQPKPKEYKRSFCFSIAAPLHVPYLIKNKMVMSAFR